MQGFSSSVQQPSWLAPAGVFRFVRRVREGIASRLRETPIVFFAVVLGIALGFKVAIGWLKPAAEPEGPGVARLVAAPSRVRSSAKVTPVADPSAAPLPSASHAMPGVDPGPNARPSRRRTRHAH